MSILTAASGASAWRGYEYFRGDHVRSFEQVGDGAYKGEVAGSAQTPYHVAINTEHVRSSKCDCPYANGKRIICKHMVALYFFIRC